MPSVCVGIQLKAGHFLTLLSGESRGIWISPQNVQYRSLKQALRNGFVDVNQVGTQYVPYCGNSWGWICGP